MADDDEDYDEAASGPPDPLLTRPFGTNPLWKDVTPIKQDDGPDPVVPIAYNPVFVETMDYFRAILKANEMSIRALVLTREVIMGNAANYTAWHFRRLCLMALKADLRTELQWVEEMTAYSPKNYQLWHHRRVLLTELNSPLNDLKHTELVLAKDAKNYHVWSHRQWLLTHFHLWETHTHHELDFCDRLIGLDVRNNSAWNQRHFVNTHYWGQPLPNQITGEKKAAAATATAATDAATTAPATATAAEAATATSTSATGAADAAAGPWSAATISSEIKYASDRIRKVPTNESPWNYLEGMLSKKHYSAEAHGTALIAFCNEIIKQDATCRFAYAALLEVYERGAVGSPAKHSAAAVEVATALAESLDPVRHKYWLWRRDNYGKPLPAMQPSLATAIDSGAKPALPLSAAAPATATAAATAATTTTASAAKA